ncbi:TraR/DksA C4-type zinc finger protein [Anaerosinus massiliensis]|uniref:TraR/DksA C4-type zinc finger protein n=1 Tax=Massilibacillus massiliensis TaxID=1806837 RepID=UPI0018FE4570|nr:TraR/DksA C4-type zinc finger protein [Massilibacillus massiliensis]
MSDISKEQLNSYEKRLIDEKEQILQTISHIEENGLEETMAETSTELSMYDNHPADVSDQLFERSKDIALRDHANVLLEKLEVALKKIEDGSYGICSHCGEAIDRERLEAVPSAALCLPCQEKEDEMRLTTRPMEEEILAPLFQKSFFENGDDIVFDGDDVSLEGDNA